MFLSGRIHHITNNEQLYVLQGDHMQKDPIKQAHIGYDTDPDFSRPLFEVPAEAQERMLGQLSLLSNNSQSFYLFSIA